MADELLVIKRQYVFKGFFSPLGQNNFGENSCSKASLRQCDDMKKWNVFGEQMIAVCKQIVAQSA